MICFSVMIWILPVHKRKNLILSYLTSLALEALRKETRINWKIHKMKKNPTKVSIQLWFLQLFHISFIGTPQFSIVLVMWTCLLQLLSKCQRDGCGAGVLPDNMRTVKNGVCIDILSVWKINANVCFGCCSEVLLSQPNPNHNHNPNPNTTKSWVRHGNR